MGALLLDAGSHKGKNQLFGLVSLDAPRMEADMIMLGMLRHRFSKAAHVHLQ